MIKLSRLYARSLLPSYPVIYHSSGPEWSPPKLWERMAAITFAKSYLDSMREQLSKQFNEYFATSFVFARPRTTVRHPSCRHSCNKTCQSQTHPQLLFPWEQASSTIVWTFSNFQRCVCVFAGKRCLAFEVAQISALLSNWGCNSHVIMKIESHASGSKGPFSLKSGSGKWSFQHPSPIFFPKNSLFLSYPNVFPLARILCMQRGMQWERERKKKKKYIYIKREKNIKGGKGSKTRGKNRAKPPGNHLHLKAKGFSVGGSAEREEPSQNRSFWSRNTFNARPSAFKPFLQT